MAFLVRRLTADPRNVRAEHLKGISETERRKHGNEVFVRPIVRNWRQIMIALDRIERLDFALHSGVIGRWSVQKLPAFAQGWTQWRGNESLQRWKDLHNRRPGEGRHVSVLPSRHASVSVSAWRLSSLLAGSSS